MGSNIDTQHCAKLNLLGISFINESMDYALDLIDCRIAQQQKTRFFYVNADCYNKIFIDKEYKRILNANDVIFPDGSGIKLGAKLIGKNLRDNVNGTDLLPLLCQRAVKNSYKIYLLGAAPGIVEQMGKNLQSSYPGLDICGTRNGFFNWEKESSTVVATVNASQADVLLVAMGAPLQEKWIDQNFSALTPTILMGVGGLFDFYSGRIPRAPLWMRRLGIEWTFRLMQEPKRMWKRYILGNPLFLYRVWRWKKANLQK